MQHSQYVKYPTAARTSIMNIDTERIDDAILALLYLTLPDSCSAEKL
jgi:hypothetical protein